MDTIKNITITIEGEGLSYKGAVDEVAAGQILNFCLGTQNLQNNSGMSLPNKVADSKESRESAAEYINRFIAKRNPDKILVLAGYLKNNFGKELFHPNEIKVLFREAGEALPANFGRDFRWAISNGWIAQDPTEKELHYVTNTGIRVMNEGFPEDLVKKSRGKVPRSKKSKETQE